VTIKKDEAFGVNVFGDEETPCSLSFTAVQKFLEDRDERRAERAQGIFDSGDVYSTTRQGKTLKAKVSGNENPYYHITIVLESSLRVLSKKVGLERCLNGKHTNTSGPTHLRPDGFVFFQQMTRVSDKIIDYNCTCPDWGEPCKHVGAVLLTWSLEPEWFVYTYFGVN